MAGKYRAVGWNRQKRIYDLATFGVLFALIGTFAAVSFVTHPRYTPEMLMVRATALGAMLLLHLILCIGPLARLSPTYLPLLYNRRHLGVTMFFLALVHAALSTVMFHAMGPVNPLVSIFTAYQMEYSGGRISDFPFEPFGFLALSIFLVMAITSHDFWLKFLGASFWKTLHLGVYFAYGSLIVHVALGALQSETSSFYPALMGVGFALVLGLHLAAGIKERRHDRSKATHGLDGYERACNVDELKEGCGKTVVIGGERRAAFLHAGRVYALSNVCRHQGGPIGEGRILDGCITCPWHGWQYHPDTGVSPPPFHEVVETYPVRVQDGTVFIHPEPNPLETKMDGAPVAVGEN